MRKIYLSMLLVMLTALGMQAQVKTLSDLSNSKAYTIASQRCFLQTIEGGDKLYTSTGSVEGISTTADATDKYQQFALLKGATDYYLYSVGAEKFVNSDGSLAEKPSSSTAIDVTETGNDTYPLTLHYGSNYLNTQVSGQSSVGYILNTWNTMDAGNQFSVVEAADTDLASALSAIDNYENHSITVTVRYSYLYNGAEAYTYTTTLKGAAPLEVSYDAPSTYLGATCESTQRESETANESKTIDVVYTYQADLAALPFVPATVTDGQYGKGTKWYYLSPMKTTNYAHYDNTGNSGAGGYAYTKNINSAPADANYFFTFTGNPVSGFQIRNYAAGATRAAVADIDNDPYYVYVEENNSSDFQLEAGSSEGQFRFHFGAYDAYGQAYLNAYYNPLYIWAYTWSSGWAGWVASSSDSQFYIQEVSDEMIELVAGGQNEYESISPEEGALNGGVKEFSILFSKDIYRVYGLDHEGGPMQEESDGTKVITLTNGDGETVITFEMDGEGNGYTLDEENPKLLKIYMDAELTTVGTYTLTIPSGLVYTESGLTNAERTIIYKVKEDFQTTTVTARVYSSPFGAFSGEAWSATLLPYDAALGYYEIQVQVDATDDVTFLGYTGNKKDNLQLTFDPSDGSINSVNNDDPDGSGWHWLDCNVLDGTYEGYYFLPGSSYCNIDFSDEGGHGTAKITGNEYDTNTNYCLFIEWYMDNRFANDDMVIALESLDPAEGQVDELSTITATYAYAFTEMGDATPTLTDKKGNSVGVDITAAISTANPQQIILTLSKPITADGTYKLIMPTGVAIREADEHSGYSESVEATYIVGEVKPDVVTWSVAATDVLVEDEGTTALLEQGGNFTGISVDFYEVSDRLVINNFMGAEGKSLEFAFDDDLATVLTINGEEPDSYGSVGVNTGFADYYFTYIYPGNCSFEFGPDYGLIILKGYFYKNADDAGSWRYYAITWGKRVEKEVIAGKIQNTPLEGYEGTAWTQLPYTADGSYDVKVRIDSDTKFTIFNYTGVEGENKTIEFDPETHYVTKIDEQGPDKYGTVFCYSKVLDGVDWGEGYDMGYYEYTGEYSLAGYDKESKSGYAVLLGVDYTDETSEYGDDRYIFLTFGEQADGIALPTTVKSATLYDLSGRRITQKPAKGIYITNGKKVVK